jgi:hypothetical protein
VKKIRPEYPRRREMLATPFQPLADDEFLRLVAEGTAVPTREGGSLLVAKWRDRPGMEPKAFLAALKAQGAHLEVRRFRADVHVRVARLRSDRGTGPVASASAGRP